MDVQMFEKDVLLLHPKDVLMQSPTELTRYSIVSWSLQYKNESMKTNLYTECFFPRGVLGMRDCMANFLQGKYTLLP